MLHRNVGLTLLYSGGDLEKARAVLAQGLDADPRQSPGVPRARPGARARRATRGGAGGGTAPLPGPGAPAVGARAQARAGPRRRRTLRRGRGPVPRPLLPARGVRDERPRRPGSRCGSSGRWRSARSGGSREALRGRRVARPGPSKISRSRRTASAPSSTSRASSTGSASCYAQCRATEPARAAWTKAAAASDGFPFLGPVYAWRAARRLGPVDEAQWRDRLAALARGDRHPARRRDELPGPAGRRAGADPRVSRPRRRGAGGDRPRAAAARQTPRPPHRARDGEAVAEGGFAMKRRHRATAPLTNATRVAAAFLALTLAPVVTPAAPARADAPIWPLPREAKFLDDRLLLTDAVIVVPAGAPALQRPGACSPRSCRTSSRSRCRSRSPASSRRGVPRSSSGPRPRPSWRLASARAAPAPRATSCA